MLGRVYKITSEKAGLCYIGSTVKKLNERFLCHKRQRRRWLKGKDYNCTSYQVLDCDDAKIELLEEMEVDDKTELYKREGHYQQTVECVNKKTAGLSRKESQKKYHQENKEQLIEYNKKWREENKEQINARTKIKHTCECGGQYTHNNKSRHLKTNRHQDYTNKTEK